MAPLTVREAAYVLGISDKRVHQAIDRDRLALSMKEPGADHRAHRAIPLADLLVFAIEEQLATLVALTASARHTLRERIGALPLKVPSDLALTGQLVTVGPLRISMSEVFDPIMPRLVRVLESRSVVGIHPQLQCGEPVIQGTRIPLSLLFDLQSQGVQPAELLADYPALSEEVLQRALLYAQLHPRVGRPRQSRAPWRQQAPRARIEPSAGQETGVTRGVLARKRSRPASLATH